MPYDRVVIMVAKYLCMGPFQQLECTAGFGSIETIGLLPVALVLA
jgi:hypothetical protein